MSELSLTVIAQDTAFGAQRDPLADLLFIPKVLKSQPKHAMMEGGGKLLRK